MQPSVASGPESFSPPLSQRTCRLPLSSRAQQAPGFSSPPLCLSFLILVHGHLIFHPHYDFLICFIYFTYLLLQFGEKRMHSNLNPPSHLKGKVNYTNGVLFERPYVTHQIVAKRHWGKQYESKTGNPGEKVAKRPLVGDHSPRPCPSALFLRLFRLPVETLTAEAGAGGQGVPRATGITRDPGLRHQFWPSPEGGLPWRSRLSPEVPKPQGNR